MIVPFATLAALLAGAVVCWLVLRRLVPVPVAVPDPQPAERATWSRSARELYRTVVGVVDDLDALDASSPRADAVLDPLDPLAPRAWFVGAVTRARGTATWAQTLRDQAVGRATARACDRVAAGMAELADAASAALADPGDAVRGRQLDVARRQVRAEVEQLVRLL